MRFHLCSVSDVRPPTIVMYKNRCMICERNEAQKRASYAADGADGLCINLMVCPHCLVALGEHPTADQLSGQARPAPSGIHSGPRSQSSSSSGAITVTPGAGC